MSLHVTVSATVAHDADLHIHATDDDGHAVRLTVRDYTLDLAPGDSLHFGCAGVQYDDGTVFGGGGEVYHDGERYPYTRISHDTILEGWHVVPVAA